MVQSAHIQIWFAGGGFHAVFQFIVVRQQLQQDKPNVQVHELRLCVRLNFSQDPVAVLCAGNRQILEKTTECPHSRDEEEEQCCSAWYVKKSRIMLFSLCMTVDKML